MVTIGTKAGAGVAEVNGTKLYYELRGSALNPKRVPVLFIAGATGDAGHFDRVADLLADEFIVLTYDRRGNSRSPRPAGWDSTSTDEQADDAAALLKALNLAPAAVFGSSSGAIIALNLAIRHPEAVRGTILHEPPLMSVLAEPEQTMGYTRSIVERGMAAGGHRGAVEAFARFAAGDAAFEAFDPDLKERILGNGETLFGVEFGAFEAYHPDDTTLASVKPPVEVMAGAESAPFFLEAAQWLARHLNTRLITIPGAHTPYHDCPQELADAIRTFLQRVN
ncbi:MAG TPA: alpha/beta hydrolase [Chloroflexia bacterium]|nr:alpha/beta hydrolase [Chloroflexia bacterium]